jgi:SAM-dependent methyltransferase
VPGEAAQPDRPSHLRAPPRGSPFRFLVLALRQAIARGVARLELGVEVRVLDFGCGEMQYRALLPGDAAVVGADLPSNPAAQLEIRADGRLPVKEKTFDAVLSTQVLEHVADPAVYLRECNRVLVNGGKLLLSTHGIMLYHPDPEDLWRWTWQGLERVIEDAGFAVQAREGVMGLATTGLQLFQDGVYHRLRRAWAKRAFASVMQWAIARCARWEPPRMARHNALVFVVNAVKVRDVA